MFSLRRHSLLRGTLLLTAASLGLRGSSMCFQVFLSNRIGAGGVGLLQLISSVSVLAMTIGTAGVRVASMYLTAEEYGARRPGGMRKALFCCLLYGLVASSLGGFLLHRASDWIALHWIQDIRAASSLRVIAWGMPVSCLWSVMAGYFTARSQLRQLVWVEFVDQAISIGLTVVLLLTWAGADTERACLSIHLANTAGTAVTLVLLLLQALAARRAPIPQGLRMWRRLIRLCLPLAANDTLRSGLSTTEHLLIPRGLARAGAGAQGAMASYGTIHGMVFPVMMFPSVLLYSLSDLLVPELARCRAARDLRRIRSLSDRCLRMGLLFSAAVAGLCYAVADPLAQLLFSSAEAGLYLRLFAPLVVVLYMDAMVDGMHKGMGEQVYCVRVNTLTNLLDVALLWLLLPRWGIAGYFFTFTLTHFLNFYLSLSRLLTATGYTPPLGYVCKVLLSAAAAAWAARQLCRLWAAPLTACLLGLALYGALLWALTALTAALSRADLQWLSGALGVGKSH